MRSVILGFCVFATVYAGAPASTSLLNKIGVMVTVQAAENGSELPFKGNLQASEAIDGALHQLVGTGNATHLGQFTFTADITVDDQTAQGEGTVVWTAANGDQIFATTIGEAVVDFPTVTITETQIITGGTGRFSNASGTITVDRSLNLLTGITTGSFTGTINIGH
jgi:hypothetical protein